MRQVTSRIGAWLAWLSPPAPPPASWHASVPRATGLFTMTGFALLVVAFAGFGIWASTALIAGAVVTSGVFVATGENKTIQHLEGGVIRDILVREGDIVDVGQPLVQLDETAARAEMRRLTLRKLRLLAIEARLKAEINEWPEVRLPPELDGGIGDEDIAAIVEAQRLTFRARRDNFLSEVATLRESINALEQRMEGGQTQLRYVERQLSIFEEELADKSQLLRGGLIRKPEVLSLERARASLNGEIGRLNGEIGDVRERIARTREQITTVRSAMIKAAVEQMHEVAGELNDVRERMHAARNVLERVLVVAPVRGVIVKLKYHTPGGVIEAGKNIMEILPLQEELIIEGRVRPQDIDTVKRGQHATVRLVALNRRVTPMVRGEVVYISADAVSDDQRGTRGPNDIYVARVKLDPAEVNTIHGFKPTPGMPAELYIQTAERTFLEYLLKPVYDSMSRAFRET